ncbi:MAG: non-canonical purine NTP pyrophosphatase, RdgB/HAM1 family [Acidobacteria bacterium]|nr:MAG: non-canonical purine NTP pyrophosphatase, RdgB/HAM1 family [Acidobacteriota bacterium]
MPEPVKLLLASSNPGKLREYQVLAEGSAVELALLPGFDRLPRFDESAPTLAENALGKALHYSRFAELPVIADDSGLVVPALGGAPGVHSARYGGPQASDADRIQKLLAELRGKGVTERCARFVCVLALALQGQVLAVFSDLVTGELLETPRGSEGFGYDPIFFFPTLGRSFAELTREEKNQHSHRGKAFRKLLAFLESRPRQRPEVSSG